MAVPYRVSRKRKRQGPPQVVRRGVPLRELKEVAGTDVKGLIYFKPPPSLTSTAYFEELTCSGVYLVLVTFSRDRELIRDTLYEDELLLEKDGKWTRYHIEHTVFRPNAYRDLEILVVSPLS